MPRSRHGGSAHRPSFNTLEMDCEKANVVTRCLRFCLSDITCCRSLVSCFQPHPSDDHIRRVAIPLIKSPVNGHLAYGFGPYYLIGIGCRQCYGRTRHSGHCGRNIGMYTVLPVDTQNGIHRRTFSTKTNVLTDGRRAFITTAVTVAATESSDPAFNSTRK